jgi:hypothetical protein
VAEAHQNSQGFRCDFLDNTQGYLFTILYIFNYRVPGMYIDGLSFDRTALSWVLLGHITPLPSDKKERTMPLNMKEEYISQY